MRRLAVRPARPSDAAAVAAISAREFSARWSPGAYRDEARRPDAVFLVAVDGGGTARGYAVARLVGDEARLLDLAADVDGRGTGRALWSALVRATRGRGAARLTLEVSAANARARRFYAVAGTRVVGRRPKFYNDGSDAVLMDLPLAR